MDKLDEIKIEIQRIYLQECDVVPKYMNVIESLRPELKSESDKLKIELADMFLSTNHYKTAVWFTKRELQEKYQILINKIKELECTQ